MKKGTIVFSLLAFLFAGQLSAGAAAPKPPQIIQFGSHTAGSGSYPMLGLLAEAIIQKEKIKVRLVPAGADVARTLMAYKGQADTAALNSVSGWQIQEGLDDFSAPEWGPTPVRYLWMPEHVGTALVVRGDSAIHRIEDLKGKQVAVMPGSPSPQLMNEAYLAFGGLSWKDVKTVPFSGPVAAFDGVIKQRIDATFFNLVSGKAYELASMPCGIRYLQMPEDNKEGWKRLKTVCPPLSPKKATVGGGISETNPVWVAGQGYPNFLTWDKLGEDTAYYITKFIHETYSIYEKGNKSMKLDWTLEKCLALFDQDVVPMHKGAIRYFKEIGKWTAQREKMNEERIAHQAKLQTLWAQSKKEAEAKGLTGEKFSEFWMGKRAQAGYWVPKK